MSNYVQIVDLMVRGGIRDQQKAIIGSLQLIDSCIIC